MEKVAVNPYLPGWEYIPDGEPHVFGDRLYIFGSHDRFNGKDFCEQDYVVWSAPVDNLADWRREGVSYRKQQDPHYKASKNLWAPDVCQGTDGRFYLYYCLAMNPEIGIAVSDKPAGPYRFYDYVKDQDGNIWHKDFPFDPAILFEDKDHIWLYSGFGPKPMPAVTEDMIKKLPQFKNEPEKVIQGIVKGANQLHHPSTGSNCLRLAPDMKTVIKRTVVAPAERFAKGTSFEKHPFFEASSIRKIDRKYYFIYSSFQQHELCYATSDYPDHGFTFGGVIISNADLGYKGNKVPLNDYANNHGSVVNVKGQWFIFYHRHTNGSHYNRQGCAEPIEIKDDGSIPQVEMTSSGLNNGPLPSAHQYSAHICCNLIPKEGCVKLDSPRKTPRHLFITEEKTGTKNVNEYVHDLQNGDLCAVKYLKFDHEKKLQVTARGKGTLAVRLDSATSTPVAIVKVNDKDWHNFAIKLLQSLAGVHAVYFTGLEENSHLDLSSWAFGK